MSFIYLASPYSDQSSTMRQIRTDAVAIATADLMAAGHVVFSPVVHGHALDHLLKETHAFWMKQCFGMLEKADALYILKLDGWQHSAGLLQEFDYATQKGMPIHYLESLFSSGL